MELSGKGPGRPMELLKVLLALLVSCFSWRLAPCMGGGAGVMAATNEVVAAAEKPILLWVFGAVIALCLIAFRSLRAALCIVLPLAIVSYLAYAVMVFLEIGLKTSTLPVVALGVGIGVDYGIYIFARLLTDLRAGEYFEDAMFSAFRDAGAAVVFTGLTLAIGVGDGVRLVAVLRIKRPGKG